MVFSVWPLLLVLCGGFEMNLNLPEGVDFTGIFTDLISCALPFLAISLVFMVFSLLKKYIKWAGNKK